MIALEPGDAGAFMQRLGPAIDAAFGRPKAIVSVSAHTAARVPVVLAAARHEAIYDFGDFDRRLNEMRYDAPGDPALADAHDRPAPRRRHRGAAGRRRRPRPRRLDGAALHLPRRRHSDRAAGLRAGRSAGEAVRARRRPRLARRRGRARPRQRQHHPQPAARVQRRRPASGQDAAGDPGERGLPPLDRRAGGGARLGRALRLPRARRRMRSTCIRPTSTCCPGTSPPAPAAASTPPLRIHASATMGSLGMDAYAFGSDAPRLAEALAPAEAT